nr:hypothetical protein BaRGS_029997 [Batillaria attramentaria]
MFKTVDNSVDPVEVVSDSSCDSFRTAPLSSLSSNPCRIPTIEYSPLDLSWELIQSPPMAGSSTSTEFVPSHDLKQNVGYVFQTLV